MKRWCAALRTIQYSFSGNQQFCVYLWFGLPARNNDQSGISKLKIISGKYVSNSA
ncbi:hypothetical protein SALWKB2_2232 [Snodgrassella alvi wkB2]|nr:hypothetical protein SALWKB2_2232 [Snodgrassella alvi wkB2]